MFLSLEWENCPQKLLQKILYLRTSISASIPGRPKAAVLPGEGFFLTEFSLLTQLFLLNNFSSLSTEQFNTIILTIINNILKCDTFCIIPLNCYLSHLFQFNFLMYILFQELECKIFEGNVGLLVKLSIKRSHGSHYPGISLNGYPQSLVPHKTSSTGVTHDIG